MFTECFAAMANAAYARASGDDRAAEDAVALLQTVRRHLSTPGLLPAKFVSGTRPMKSIGAPMILMNVGQVLETLDELGLD